MMMMMMMMLTSTMAEPHVSRMQAAKKTLSGRGGNEGNTKELITVVWRRRSHGITYAQRGGVTTHTHTSDAAEDLYSRGPPATWIPRLPGWWSDPARKDQRVKNNKLRVTVTLGGSIRSEWSASRGAAHPSRGLPEQRPVVHAAAAAAAGAVRPGCEVVHGPRKTLSTEPARLSAAPPPGDVGPLQHVGGAARLLLLLLLLLRTASRKPSAGGWRHHGGRPAARWASYFTCGTKRNKTITTGNDELSQLPAWSNICISHKFRSSSNVLFYF